MDAVAFNALLDSLKAMGFQGDALALQRLMAEAQAESLERMILNSCKGLACSSAQALLNRVLAHSRKHRMTTTLAHSKESLTISRRARDAAVRIARLDIQEQRLVFHRNGKVVGERLARA